MAKKIKITRYTPPGLELNPETPLKLKSDQWRRDLHDRMTGGLDAPHKTTQRIVLEEKVRLAGNAARQGKMEKIPVKKKS